MSGTTVWQAREDPNAGLQKHKCKNQQQLSKDDKITQARQKLGTCQRAERNGGLEYTPGNQGDGKHCVRQLQQNRGKLKSIQSTQDTKLSK